MKLSILIPCYNEKDTIVTILDAVKLVDLTMDMVPIREHERPSRATLEKEIIIVDDGSTDGTRNILAGLAPEESVKVVMHPHNRGKGAAVQTAVQHASGDILIIQDADLEYDPRDYPRLVLPILEGRAKVVYGSRFLGGPRSAMMFTHMLANQSLTLATNLLYNSILSDMETGYKVFRADVIKDIRLRSRRFDLEPEVTAKVLKRGIHIFEVPISYTGREYAEGKKIGLKDAFQAIWTLIKYRFID